MKTIQEIKDAKAILESEISSLIAKFERENQVEIYRVMIERTGIESEWGTPINNVLEVIEIIEF